MVLYQSDIYRAHGAFLCVHACIRESIRESSACGTLTALHGYDRWPNMHAAIIEGQQEASNFNLQTEEMTSPNIEETDSIVSSTYRHTVSSTYTAYAARVEHQHSERDLLTFELARALSTSLFC